MEDANHFGKKSLKNNQALTLSVGAFIYKLIKIGIKMKITDVANSWVEGTSAQTSSLVTKEGSIWSYNLLIGKTAPDGTLIIYDYTNSAGNYISQSTTYHVSSIVKAAYNNAKAGQKVVITPRVPYKRNKQTSKKVTRA